VIALDHSGSMGNFTDKNEWTHDKVYRPTRRWEMVAKAAKNTLLNLLDIHGSPEKMKVLIMRYDSKGAHVNWDMKPLTDIIPESVW